MNPKQFHCQHRGQRYGKSPPHSHTICHFTISSSFHSRICLRYLGMDRCRENWRLLKLTIKNRTFLTSRPILPRRNETIRSTNRHQRSHKTKSRARSSWGQVHRRHLHDWIIRRCTQQKHKLIVNGNIGKRFIKISLSSASWIDLPIGCTSATAFIPILLDIGSQTIIPLHTYYQPTRYCTESDKQQRVLVGLFDLKMQWQMLTISDFSLGSTTKPVFAATAALLAIQSVFQRWDSATDRLIGLNCRWTGE